MKTFFVALALLLVAGFVFAEETGQPNWNNDLGKWGNPLRQCLVGHTHDYTCDERNPEVNLGGKVIYKLVEDGEEGQNQTVWETLIPDWLEGGYTYDIANTTTDDKHKFTFQGVWVIGR